ncbi:hypothetical protein [Pseudomonas sp.]|uniref:hypothetical protein n=1 Tax=Pseudomonas sp. TaxID=306 RepID=UPI0028AFCABB|nr:hypothetical protein [Pseudomonas sp.]
MRKPTPLRPLLFLFAAVLLLGGCASSRIAHPPAAISEGEARQVIEQVVRANRPGLRADALEFTQTYLWFGNGIITPVAGVGSAASLGSAALASDVAGAEPADSERLYFGNLGESRLLGGSGNYEVLLINVDGAALNAFQVENRAQGERFIDALHFFRSRALAAQDAG